MRKFGLAALAALGMLTAAGAAAAGEVVVNLDGAQARGGPLLVALQTREEFMQRGRGARVLTPVAGRNTVRFEGVPAGDYVVMAFHDENANGRLDMDGYMPGEGWAMSGPPLRAAPSFDLLKVPVAEAGGEITVALTYPHPAG